MAEEKHEIPDQGLDSETMNAFNYVLRSVKGISPVSVVPELTVLDTEDSE